MKLVSGALTIFFTLVPIVILVAIIAQEWKYLETRRNIVMDEQALFHAPDAFHVVTLLKMAEGQDLLDGVRGLVDATEAEAGKTIYAGKIVFHGQVSAQLPPEDWDAFVLTQFASREAWDKAAAGAPIATAREAVAASYTLGMKRNPFGNLAIPIVLLGQRVMQKVRGEAPRYPFTPAQVPADAPPEALAQRDEIVGKLLANTEYGKEALVILNFQKYGTAEQVKADAEYTGEMMAMMAELSIGPMHIGKSVTLEGDADFDTIVIVYYPGVEFFADMVQSSFYQSIFGNKQLGDNLSTPSVPLLPHL